MCTSVCFLFLNYYGTFRKGMKETVKVYMKEERNEKEEQIVVGANVSRRMDIVRLRPIRHLHNAIACVPYSKLANSSI